MKQINPTAIIKDNSLSSLRTDTIAVIGKRDYQKELLNAPAAIKPT